MPNSDMVHASPGKLAPFEDAGEGDESVDSLSSSPKRGKKKRDNSTLRKAPQAPKRFKSSYICFFMAKQPEIKEELGDKATVTDISKRSAEMWRNLPADQRGHWDEVAAKDKQRYIAEKSTYTGPWQVPYKRAKKDPSAPKRPMSAFLYFSQGKRKSISDKNPDMKNTEISRLLGEMWRNSTEEERRPHVEKEKEEREKYKKAISEWRVDFERKKEEQQKQQAAEMTQQPQWVQHAPHYPPPESGDYHGQNVPMHYAQPPPYGMPPPSSQHHYGHYAPPPPPHHYYAPQYPLPGPYQYPTNGKQPIILGPNGMPRYAPRPPAPPTSYSGPPQDYEESQEPLPYVADQIQEPQAAG